MISMSLAFLKDSKGAIVNVSGTAGIMPEPGGLVFSVSKAMINSMTQCAALELGCFGIRVNAVAPGFVDTKARVTPSLNGEPTMGLKLGEYNAMKATVAQASPLDGTV